MPWKCAYVLTTSRIFLSTVSEIITVSHFFAEATAIITASAVAVVPSYMDAFDMSIPVSSAIIDWYSKM